MNATQPRVYLDIDIGNAQEYEAQCQAFNRAGAFLKQNGPSYGLGTDIDALDESSRETLKELYEADPSWVEKGEVRVVKPIPIRAGRIVIELFARDAPEAVENFMCLCTGEKGRSKTGSNKNLCYMGCKFHRIVKGFICQGGDFTRGDGSGGESIWGKKFKDEKGGLKLTHNQVGVVGMANSGKNSNTSQFYFTLAAPLDRLNGKHVIFGKVVEGLDILTRINNEAASEDGTPKTDVVISHCGKL